MKWLFLAGFVFSFGSASVAYAGNDCTDTYEQIKNQQFEEPPVFGLSMFDTAVEMLGLDSESKAGVYGGMGFIYHFGKANIPKNDQKSLEYFNKAASIESKFSLCISEIGERFLKGYGEEKDVHKGIKWLKEAAIYDSKIQLRLGVPGMPCCEAV